MSGTYQAICAEGRLERPWLSMHVAGDADFIGWRSSLFQLAYLPAGYPRQFDPVDDMAAIRYRRHYRLAVALYFRRARRRIATP